MKKSKKIAVILSFILLVSTIMIPVRARAVIDVATEGKTKQLVLDKDNEKIFQINISGNVGIDVVNGDKDTKITLKDSTGNILKTDDGAIKQEVIPGQYSIVADKDCVVDVTNLECVTRGLAGGDKINLDDKINAKIYRLNFAHYGYDLFTETSANEGIYQDTVLTLYNSDYKVVAESDNISDINKYSKIIKSLPIDIYYLKVSNKVPGENLSTLIYLGSNTKKYLYSEITSPRAGGYFLQGDEVKVQAYVNSDKATVKLNYKGEEASSSVPNVMNLDYGTMVRNEKGNNYESVIKANKDKFLESLFDENTKTHNSPELTAIATLGEDSRASESLDFYITALTRERYEKQDSSWYYNTPYDNSFRGYASNRYDCIAYAYDIVDHRVWTMRIPGESVSLDYFLPYILKWQEREGPAFAHVLDREMPNTDVIFYGGGSHAAKVVEWDENLLPTKVISKWGGCELIESKPYAMEGYGEAQYWVGGKYEVNR